ncbi:baseplate J/gp47 family protein [Paenibacillus sp. y28]|uniref:baseplate J/gp47 family protein n=1 Tax=Paenibacillus sp. y28 TaxID=3129110 RepID=UPI00301AB885
MYELQTYEALLKRMLERVPASVDKREGSIIYDALAPAALELAQMYVELDANLRLAFADTSSGEWLSRRTEEFGVTRQAATKAKRKGSFYNQSGEWSDIPLNSRFAIQGVKYTAVEKIEPGQFVLECETAGTAGNQHFGTLLPVDYINGLSRAELGDVLVPGADEESDEALRARYFAAVNEQPFGGNIADYKREIGGIAGVGGVKIFPVWQGGGTVKCTLIASDWSAPAAALVDEVQAFMDPAPRHGEGLGLAPLGHQVTIAGVEGVAVDVTATLTLQNGTTLGQVQDAIHEVISDYMLSLRKAWPEEERLIVRISQIDARILTIAGVADVTNTLLNGAAANLELDGEQIPNPGAVVLHVN